MSSEFSFRDQDAFVIVYTEPDKPPSNGVDMGSKTPKEMVVECAVNESFLDVMLRIRDLECLNEYPTDKSPKICQKYVLILLLTDIM